MINKISIINNGQSVTICNLDNNDKVISSKEVTMSDSLLDDKNLINTAAIIGELDITALEFIRDYELLYAVTGTVFGIKVLKEAIFTRREKTVEDSLMFTFHVDRACEATSIPNYIEPLYNTPLSELTDKDIAIIESMASLLNTLDDKYDFGDAVIEGTMALSDLLSDIYESRK